MSDSPIRFDVYNATPSQYRSFIQTLRTTLGIGSSHNLPVLAEQRLPPTRWIDINLYASASEFVTVRVRRDNLYVDGYLVSGQTAWREFSLEVANQPLIPGSNPLPFGGGYPQLQQFAHQGRADISLGRRPLVDALNLLRSPGSSDPDTQRARALTVIIQMISEATRLVPILELVANPATWENGARPTPNHLAFENGWEDLSGALLRMDQNSQIPFTRRLLQPNAMSIGTVEQAVAVLGILLFFRANPSSRFRASASPGLSLMADAYQPGRPLLEILWVRINNIDGEEPGDLYGTINATDSVAASAYSLFNRTTSNVQKAGPGDHVELTGPARAISASGSVAVALKLYDYDALSPDDEIVNETIYWNPFSAANQFDVPVNLGVSGQYGNASVYYVVVGNAAEAVIEIVLINGDGEDPADVYGDITASTGKFGQITLFKRASGDYTQVRPGAAIPLLRPAAVVQMEDKITISAHLWDYDSLSPDDEIANGSVTFAPQLDQSSPPQNINGQYGRVEVRVTWY